MDAVDLVSVEGGASDLVRERPENRILKRIRMLIEYYITAISREFNLFATSDIAVDRIQVSMHIELSVARQPEYVRGATVHEVRNGRSVAHLLQVIFATVR